MVGEARGREPLALLKAWNTGRPGGVATIHANSDEDALYRLEDLIGEVSEAVPQRSIASATNLVVFVERIGVAPRRMVSHTIRVDICSNHGCVFHSVACQIVGYSANNAEWTALVGRGPTLRRLI